MGWAARFRRSAILRGVSASHIRADHAVNRARINARYASALPGLAPMPSLIRLRQARLDGLVDVCDLMLEKLWEFLVRSRGPRKEAARFVERAEVGGFFRDRCPLR